MKKGLNKILVCILSLILSCVLFMPRISSYSRAEDSSSETIEEPKYSLIGADFNTSGNTLEHYHISSSRVSSFTPFDLAEGERKEGYSFGLPTGERNQIDNQFIYVNNVDVPKQDNSLYIWVNFDSVYLHNLTITIEFDNSSTLIWSLDTETLVELVKKSNTVNILSLPYAWNHIELPFSMALKNGEIYTAEKLNAINKIIFDFTSEEITTEGEENGNSSVEDELNITYSTLLFYDIYLAKSQNLDKYNVIEKQNYRFYDLIFYSDEFVNSICKGDTINLPSSYKSVVKYAWNGYDDLRDGGLNSITWQIVVKTPDSNNPYLYPSFGSKITFDKEGVYEIFYQCKDARLSNSQPIVSDSVKINVRTLRPVYFDKATFKMEVNKTYMINVYTSNAFTSITDLSFDAQDENIIIEYKGNGVLAVTPKASGEYTIDVKISGIRAAINQEKEYTETLKIEASQVSKDDNKIVKIILFIALGVFVVIIIGVVIKKIIDARKFDVR